MATVNEPLSVQAYGELRRRIIVGIYEQGTRLLEAAVAADLGVSRVPVREAIPKLAAEGFVHMTPRHGIFVSKWTIQSINDLFDVRLALEPYAARLGAVRSGHHSGGIDSLKESLIRSEEEQLTNDSYKVSSANADLHQIIVATANNTLLSRLMAAIAGRITWLFYMTSQRDAAVADGEHRAIVEAIIQGNGLLASSLMTAHIESGRRPSLESMKLLLNSSALAEHVVSSE